MEFSLSLVIVAAVGSFAGILGYFLMRRKFLLELEKGKRREAELVRRAYENAVLKEIGDRIGYSLDATKITEIISGSLGELLPYSTVSHMVLERNSEKIVLEVHVNERVGRKFISDVKVKMLAAFSEMLGEPLSDFEVDERVLGKILDELKDEPVRSFFNLPIEISGRVAGIITIASNKEGLYMDEETEILYRITRQASDAVSKFQGVLQNEKNRLVQSVESLSDGILMVDVDYKVILANKKLRQVLELVDNPKTFDVVNAISGKFDLRTRIEEAIQRREPLPMEEVVIRDKILQIVISAVFDNRTHKAIGAVALFHDVTDSRSLEKLRQDFMAMMVHELRSPLTSIKSTVEFLLEDNLKESKDELKNYLTIIDSTSQTMLDLVNDLLDASKLESGKFEVVCEEGELGQIILERVEAHKLLAQEKNLEFDVEIAKDLPPAWFDKVRIKQVLNNLISNALKYTDKGSIKVTVAPEVVNGVPIDILVSVSDTGIGIDPEKANKLFSRFGQLEEGMKRSGNKSTGLGLFISKGITEASGGKIWLKSGGLGLGSTFYFTVALASGDGKVKANISKKSAKLFQSAARTAVRSFSTDKVGRA